MAETLRSLPKNHPRRAHILKAYWKIRFLLKYQAAEGMWRHLIDLPGAWPQIPFCPPPRDSVSEVTSTKLHRCGLALSSEVLDQSQAQLYLIWKYHNDAGSRGTRLGVGVMH